MPRHPIEELNKVLKSDFMVMEERSGKVPIPLYGRLAHIFFDGFCIRCAIRWIESDMGPCRKAIGLNQIRYLESEYAIIKKYLKHKEVHARKVDLATTARMYHRSGLPRYNTQYFNATLEALKECKYE